MIVKWYRNTGRKGDHMLSLQEIMAATGGRCENMRELVFSGITTDSRVESRGELFVALCGERFDGHAYCQMALEHGVAAVLVSKPGYAACLSADSPCLQVAAQAVESGGGYRF